MRQIREPVIVRTLIDGQVAHTANGALCQDGDDVVLRVAGFEYTPNMLPDNCELISQPGPMLLAWAARRRQCCVKQLPS